MKQNRYNHKKYQRIKINKGIITFSLTLSLGISALVGLPFVMKKNTERVKLVDGLPSSITLIDNDYIVYVDDKKISEKKQDNSSTTNTRTCMALVDLSDVINMDKKSKIKKIINDIDMEDLFTLCDNTDSVDLYDEIKESRHSFWYDDYDKIANKVNNWLLYHGYEIMSEYAEKSIRDFISNYEPYNIPLEFDVYDVDNGDLKLDDCFYNKDKNLEIISSNNNHYKFNDNDILNAYVTMQYENSQKNKGHIGYNNSRNNYLRNAYEIISSFNYYYKGLDINVEYNGKIENNNQSTYNYVFRANDTLDIIIKRFNTDENRLLSLNKDKNLNTLTTGDTIIVPYEFVLDNQNIEQYTVVDDDTIYKIINRYGVSMTDFENANPQIANFDQIQIGEILNIPITDNKVYTTKSAGTIDIDDIILNEEDTNSNEVIVNDNSISESIARRGYATGIDISKYQPQIDFNKVSSNENIDFVILRTHFLGYGKKQVFTDEYAESYYNELIKRNIPVCFYVWLGLQEPQNIEKQANQIINDLANLQEKYGYTELPLIFIDYENITDSAGNIKYNMTSDPYTAGNSILNAISIFENAGYRVGVYANTSDKTNLDNAVPEIKNYDTWIACYHSNYKRDLDNVTDEKQLSVLSNRYNNEYNIFQSTSNGVVDGIDTNSGVDLNIMYVDYPKILKENNKGLTLRR